MLNPCLFRYTKSNMQKRNQYLDISQTKDLWVFITLHGVLRHVYTIMCFYPNIYIYIYICMQVCFCVGNIYFYIYFMFARVFLCVENSTS